jgi:hypothetical protein
MDTKSTWIALTTMEHYRPLQVLAIAVLYDEHVASWNQTHHPQVDSH